MAPTAQELIDAFIHPPKIVLVAQRFVSDHVVVVSHVEVWPWRVVVRALTANPGYSVQHAEAPQSDPPTGDTSQTGSVSVSIVEPSEERINRFRRDIEWMQSWVLTVDSGSKLHAAGWKGGVNEDSLWRDLELQYDVVLAPGSERLTISHPDFGLLDVNLDGIEPVDTS